MLQGNFLSFNRSVFDKQISGIIYQEDLGFYILDKNEYSLLIDTSKIICKNGAIKMFSNSCFSIIPHFNC